MVLYLCASKQCCVPCARTACKLVAAAKLHSPSGTPTTAPPATWWWSTLPTPLVTSWRWRAAHWRATAATPRVGVLQAAPAHSAAAASQQGKSRLFQGVGLPAAGLPKSHPTATHSTLTPSPGTGAVSFTCGALLRETTSSLEFTASSTRSSEHSPQNGGVPQSAMSQLVQRGSKHPFPHANGRNAACF